jgi:hypothetical protein
MGAESTVKLDEWGHVESREFPDKSVAGVMPGQYGTTRLVYSRNGDPTSGYDRVWWYASVELAVVALRGWKYPKPPTKFIRDTNKQPVTPAEDDAMAAEAVANLEYRKWGNG